MLRSSVPKFCGILFMLCSLIHCAQRSNSNKQIETRNSSTPIIDQNMEGEDWIPLVTLDANNQVQEKKISAKALELQTSDAALMINDSLLPALAKADSTNEPSSWSMRVMGVGIGITAEIGIGPIGVGFIPKMRMIFTNHANPIPPPLFL